MSNPTIVSHRGLCRSGVDAARIGENTIEALSDGIRALDVLGFPQMIEFDVRRAKDGALVLMHDEALERTTSGHGFVREYTYLELLRLDAGLGRSIPLLTDVLDRFGATPDVHFCIELKERGFAAEIGRLLVSRNLQGRATVSAFDLDDADAGDTDPERFSSWDDLALVRPEIPIALLASARKITAKGESQFVGEAVDRGASAVNPEYTGTTASLVSMAHRAGLTLSVWTVNALERYQHLLAIGVDSVFCDNPYFLATRRSAE